MLKKISVSTSHDDKFNIQKSRVNFFGRGVSALLVTDKCHFYSLLLAYGNGISIHIVLRRELCVSSQKSLTAPISILFLGLHPPLSDLDTVTQKFRGHISQGYEPQSAEGRTCVWIFLAAWGGAPCLANPELPCPFHTHLDIADGIASHCFVTSLVWLPLPPYPYSPRPTLTNKSRILILAPGYTF